MALTQDAINEAKLAEAKVANALSLSDDYKKTLLNLISISTTATNGISPEEKILKMTEAVRILAISLVDFVTTIQQTIITTIQEQNRAQCQHCKALKHANEVEEQEELERLHAKWQASKDALSNRLNSELTPIVSQPQEITVEVPEKHTWTDAMKAMICQPGFWVFATLALLSPYTIDIIKIITSFFTK